MSLNLKNEEGRRMTIPRYTDRIRSIRIKQEQHYHQHHHQQQDYDIIEIQSESEADIIENLIKVVKKIDPDFIFTEDGDSFTFPYLIHRAEINNTDLFLGREGSIPLRKPTREGTSYFSYGQVYFKPATIKLLGRIHLDKSNSFLVNETAAGLHGLYEIARICRMPLHNASRASIGKCLSSLQFYYATTQKDTLIPWKPVVAEHFKSLQELLIADRGGFIFEPEIGVHENVAEFDFVSLYPNIMFKKNLSAETINCSCCHPNSDLKVPELLDYYHICNKRTGIVPLSLNIVLQKRAKYKQLLLQSNTSSKLKTIYDARQNSLKWILVTSFGYLGFNNAKFGRIDAHIAVCAFGRQILLQAAKIAERHRFRVLHGIVDSLWVKKNKEKKKYTIGEKQEDDDDYLELKESIEKETGFAISFEGIYKWIAFVASKRNDILPVANRYFGAFEEGGSLKIRGIEARRHDTPPFLCKCQEEILQIMAKGDNIKEVKLLMPKVKSTYQKYVQLLKDGRLPIEDLVFTKQLSKNAAEYNLNRNTVEKDAIVQLCNEGKYLKAGQTLRYVIIDYYYNRKHSKCRAIPIELINRNDTTYDIKRYLELLTDTCNSVTKPFGYSLSS
jgi:DNA polymerase-2